jgi:tetratricopeptide (TPR) repeat protein
LDARRTAVVSARCRALPSAIECGRKDGPGTSNPLAAGGPLAGVAMHRRHDIVPVLLLAVLLVLLAACARPGHQQPASPGAEARAILFDDLGTHHHPVTTRSPEAQRYFDQGLQLVWAFNHEEAMRSFQEAARLDPGCAMAWWGIALARGPNYNDPGSRERDRRAEEALARARALRPAVSERERAYIDALSTRYVAEPPADRTPLDAAYATAMRELAHRYPDDLDAATLYAEALMNLRPWDLWTADGAPQPGTEEILSTLESVLARAPRHAGANHYYVHAVEASPRPERALAAAGRLETLVPGAGHLVHMPAHIYMRTGRYGDASAANVRAIAADRAYVARTAPGPVYAMMYVPHNVDFLWASASMEGRSAEALRAAREVAAMTTPDMAREMSDVEGGLVAPLFVLVRFGRWAEVLAEPAPPDDLPFARGSWHYARGFALARSRRLDEAAAELQALERVAAATPPARLIMQVNTAKAVLDLGAAVLAGELAAARGDTATAVGHLEDAVRRQDALRYMEPPPWYYPVRQSLGAVLLAAGRARQAEAVYREDLRRHPENGWSLHGLAQSLRAQRRATAAAAVEERFRQAWARADVTLAASRF